MAVERGEEEIGKGTQDRKKRKRKREDEYMNRGKENRKMQRKR
jgi:hypothetical protein